MPKRLTTDGFIHKSKEVHGDKYDYHLVNYETSNKKVEIICPTHGTFQQTPSNHLAGYSCYLCGKEESNKKTRKGLEYYITKAKEVHGNMYDYSQTSYKDVRSKSKIICKIHGPFYQSFDNHIRGKGCPNCKGKKISIAKTIDTNEFIKKAKKVHNDRFDYSKTVYKNSLVPVEIICPEHGTFTQLPISHYRGAICPECNNKKQWTTESFINYCSKLHDYKYDYSLVSYKRNNLPVEIICPVHGAFKQSPQSHLNGHGCKECYYDKIRNSDAYVDKCKEIHNDKYDYSKVVYTNARDKVTIICPIHGDFEQSIECHYRSGCPKCTRSIISDGEKELVNYIKLNYSGNVIENDRSLISPYELDIVIPEKKLAIEFDGIYWHSTAYKKDRKYHLKKTLECKGLGYQLIHLYDNEWYNNKSLLKRFILYRLGRINQSVFARSCFIDSVNKEEAKVFLDTNHIQGYVSSSVRLGLYNGGELVAYLGFRKIRDNKYLLNRYATSCIVPGGFSKLLSHFKRSYDWNEIITYADRRYSEGNLYHKTGFELDKVCPPSFDYVKGSYVYNRQQFMKHKLKDKLEFFDPKLTERENMELNGYYQIWNCGYLKFVMSK